MGHPLFMVESPSSSPYKHLSSLSRINWVKVRQSEHAQGLSAWAKGFYFFLISTLAKVDSAGSAILLPRRRFLLQGIRTNMFCLMHVFSCLPRLSGSPTLNPWSEVICENNDVLAKEREIILSQRWSNIILSMNKIGTELFQKLNYFKIKHLSSK